MITKELLNKNRVLTMSNNRKCDYLIVDVGRESTTMMGINTQRGNKDVLIIKTFYKKSNEELVNEAYWLCKEFNINIILTDGLGFDIGFIDSFKMIVPSRIVDIRQVKIRNIDNIPIIDIMNNLQFGKLRFLQSSELAQNYYYKPFLGYSTIMNFHKETDKLIDEISNIKFNSQSNGVLKIDRIDENIGKARVTCLLIYYSYDSKLCVK